LLLLSGWQLPIAADTQMTINPQRCVTLREGQPCYIRMKLSWNTSEPLTVCAYSDAEKPLACWNKSRGAVLTIEQQLLETTRFTLRSEAGDELASADVVFAWVYKSRRSRRRWRLF